MRESRIPVGSAWRLRDDYCRVVIDKRGKHLLYLWHYMNENGEIRKSGAGFCRTDSFYGWISGRSRRQGQGRWSGEAVRASQLEEAWTKMPPMFEAFGEDKESMLENMWAAFSLGKELFPQDQAQ